MTYLVCCGVLIVGALVARGVPVTPRVPDGDERWFDGAPLDPRSVAYLRGGGYGVVLTVLAELHARGAVDAGQRVRPVAPMPRDGYDDALLRAVYAGTTWCTEPRLIARLPAVRREVRRLRPDLIERGLRVPVRRQLLSFALLGYAGGLAVAGVVESGRTPSTVVGAVAVLAAVVLAASGPRRTVAGARVLRAERRLLATWVGVDQAHPQRLLAAMVAAHGRGALEVLCTRFVPLGSLAPRTLTATNAAPGTAVPGTAVVQPAPSLVPAPISILIPAPRRPVYDKVSDGPAIIVRPAFVPGLDRVAA